MLYEYEVGIPSFYLCMLMLFFVESVTFSSDVFV